MICIFRANYKRILTVTLIILTISASLIVFASASVKLFSEAIDPTELTDGVYNIVNCQTGLYLDTYDVKYDPQGRTYLAPVSAQSGQNFLIQRQDDGTYIIHPQSENGSYALSYAFDIMESEYVSKSAEISSLNRFYIIPETDNEEGRGNYVIKPAGMSDEMLALGISSSVSQFNQSLSGLAFDTGAPSQRWNLVKVSSETLSIPGGYINVRCGSTQDIYAKITPEKLIGNMVWESSNPEVATVDSQGIVNGISDGTSVITVTCGPISASVTVRVSSFEAYTWYSQHNMTSGGWDAISVKDVYFTTYSGEKKPFFINGYGANNDWMDQGCKLCSEAMILHNLGATLTTGYDFRTDKTDYLAADPFTVALANTGSTGYNLGTAWVINNPVLVNHHLINPRFTVGGKAVTTQEYYGNNLTHIKELLDEHPEGVVVGMRNTWRDTTHYVVFTECLNPNDLYGNYEFRICDSAALDPAEGDNVPFKESISYKSLGYGYGSIFEYSVYEPRH